MSAPTISTTIESYPLRSLGQPTYDADVESWLAGISVVPGEINAFGTWANSLASSLLSSSPAFRVTYGGTANAITLTTGLSLPSLTTGFAVRFRATSANTGATTINVDGLGAVSCITIPNSSGSGAALPSGYIRTNVDTTAVYDGTNWVVYRETESGSNANGSYTKYADGTMLCRHAQTVSYATAAACTGTWTFPQTFSAAPKISVSIDEDNLSAAPTIYEVVGYFDVLGTSSVRAALGRILGMTSFVSGNTAVLHMRAEGSWF